MLQHPTFAAQTSAPLRGRAVHVAMVCGGGEDPSSCGACCDRYCPCISPYPSLCTSFLTLVTAAVVAAVFGAYAFISLRLSIFRFSWSPVWFVFTNASFLALVVTALLVALALALWFVCSSPKKGIAYKICYLFMLLVCVLALAAVMVFSILIIHGASGDNTAFARELEDVWLEEVEVKNSTLPCRVQKQLRCRGFDEGDCLRDSPTFNFTRCGVVCRPQDVDGGKAEVTIVRYPGCRERISSFYIRWNAVLLAGASLACILCLVALFVTCTSISFESDR